MTEPNTPEVKASGTVLSQTILERVWSSGSAGFAGIRAAWSELLVKPGQTIQLVSAFFLCGLSVVAVREWLHSHSRPVVEVPLLLIGVFAIVIMVLRTKNAFAIGVSVLIVGTVVAGDRFMLAVTALIKGQSPETMKLVHDLYGSEVDRKMVVNAPDLASKIVDVSREASPETATKAVTKVLEDAQARSLLNQVEAGGAITPLEILVRGGDQWADFVRRYRGEFFFQNHMDFLKTIGLIRFPYKDYDSAALTDLGEQLRPLLNHSRDTPWRTSSRPPLGPELTSATDARIKKLELDTPTTAEFRDFSRDFFSVDIVTEAQYQIETSRAPQGTALDTLLILRDASLKELASDDDGGSMLFSKIKRRLRPGKYIVEVETLETSGKYQIQITKEK